MKNYASSLRQYAWIAVACVVVACAVGLLIARAQLSLYQASSVLLVDMSAPGTTYTGGPTGGTAADDLARALTYSSELQTKAVMQYILNYDPQLGQQGYTASDLITDVVPTTSTTAATVTLLATARHPADAILLANDVANGFAAYVTAQVQGQLSAARKNLTDQIGAPDPKTGAYPPGTANYAVQYWGNKLASLPNNTDPHYPVYLNSLTDATHTLDALNAQLQLLPQTVKGDAFVLQQATPQDVTTSNKGYIVVGVTAAVGLLVGLLVMLLVIFTDNRLRRDEDVKQKLGLAYLGGLSTDHRFGQEPAGGGGALHAVSDIGTNLRLTGVLPGPWRAPQGAVLLVTSPRAAEGKTTLAVALAAVLARAGQSVLVVDGNLRRPSTHLALKARAAGPGLGGLLAGTGRESVRDAVVRSSVPGVWLVPAGAAVEDPTLLLGQRLPAVLAQLRKETDIVIIDGPALLSGAEASLLATMADGIALVVDARHAKLQLLLRAKELLSSLTHTPAGIVMNRLAAARGGGYFASAFPGGPAAEKWAPVPVTPASNGNGHAAPVYESPAVSFAQAPTAGPVSAPAGLFSPNRLAAPSLPGIIPPAPAPIANVQQLAPPPSPRPASNGGFAPPPLSARENR